MAKEWKYLEACWRWFGVMAGGAILNDYRTDRTSSRDVTLDETLTTQRVIEITDLATDCNDDDNVTFRNSPLKIGANWSCRDVTRFPGLACKSPPPPSLRLFWNL